MAQVTGPVPGNGQKVELPPLSKQKSLLSQLLQEMAHREDEAGMSSCCDEDMVEEETEQEIENGFEEDGEEEGAEEEDDDEDQDMEDASLPSSSKPIRIRRPSATTYLRNQREAHKRFLYLHLVDEMRKECAAYFNRMARAKMDPQVDVDAVMPPQ